MDCIYCKKEVKKVVGMDRWHRDCREQMKQHDDDDLIEEWTTKTKGDGMLLGLGLVIGLIVGIGATLVAVFLWG